MKFSSTEIAQMVKRLRIGVISCAIFLASAIFTSGADTASSELFAKKNLVAWCIVPFDSKKRGPEERAAMLEKLGFSKFAYDYRAEHIPTFDAEIEALKRHHIELTAWWFPGVLNDEAKMTLAVFEKHKVTPQLWVTGGGEPTKSEQEQQRRIQDEADRIRPIAEAAAKVGCKVAMYNHGGWFGEPENQLAVIRLLDLPNVGIVYNQHHGHNHLARFPQLLQQMKPYLLALNLNGMVQHGDKTGQKTLQIGQGELDLKLLNIIKDSGYTGPIGILGHTSDDAEQRLQDNLDGLDWLLPQLSGNLPGPKPKPRTPVPVATVQSAQAQPASTSARLVEGRFGKALNGPAGGAFVAGRNEFRQFPLTVECWTKIVDKEPFNILVAHEQKSSGTHWELFTMAGSGNVTAYLPGFSPDHCHSKATICDGKWHHVAMVLESARVSLFVDGQQVVTQVHERNTMRSDPDDLSLASLVDKQIGCTGILDEVRISRGIRSITALPDNPFEVDDTTLALWHLDEFVDQKRFDDATKKSPALAERPSRPMSVTGKGRKIEGHWGEDVVGFRWTENDARDDRFGQMDTGPFFSGTITGAGGVVYKGIVVRLGDNRSTSICYDTELLRASAGWTGFVKFDPARFGIIVPPKTNGDVTFSTPMWAGWTRTDRFMKFRESSLYGPLPKTQAHYEGLHRHGQRVVLKYVIGTEVPPTADPAKDSLTAIFESPWLEQTNEATAISRTLRIESSETPLMLLVSDKSARVRLVAPNGTATLQSDADKNQILLVPAHSAPVTIKLLVASTTVSEPAFEKLVAASPPAEDLLALTQPGSKLWGDPLVTVGEISKSDSPLKVDTITLPFDNPFHALMFCGGHDFLPDGRALVCTLHGDVWLVDGIDETLQRISWRRFATGLFQPLGLKVVSRPDANDSEQTQSEIYVVGRDQITRLRDSNNDSEADFYENFNNDAYVSLNGHEYVTCLETDRAGNFYYAKGNCNSAIPHDGCILQVSADGKQLKVYATGFRNSNGIGMGPHDELTASPQEGDWTPGSAVFAVHEGGFYGGMMSHHRPMPPTDFERPICWFPRLADNSSGGQVWIPEDHWGSLGNHLLHLSYGQCKMRLVVQEDLLGNSTSRKGFFGQERSPLISINGGSTELPISFDSGVHRGRFNPKDGQLYLTGLRGWTTSAANDGCFQRVRYTGQPIDSLVGMKTYRNGVALTFSRPLNRDEIENTDNYELEIWNYHWSAKYGSPELKPSAPSQEGRDSVEPKSVTLLDDECTVFLEIPDLKPVDQMGISCSLRSTDGAAIEQTAYLTLNGIPDQALPEQQLHRSTSASARAALLARLSPGLMFPSQTQTGSTLQQRLIAWPSAAAGRPEAVNAVGYLKAPAKGDYWLSNAFDNEIKLTTNGESHIIGSSPAKIRLSKGLNAIRVEQSATSVHAGVRLMWESDRFPKETIPAAALFHDKSLNQPARETQLFLQGRALFAKHKCSHCHINQPNQTEEIAHGTEIERLRAAPSLEGLGSRVNIEWLAAWLEEPAKIRRDATMPKILVTQNVDSLADLLAYLMSLRDDGNESQQQSDNIKETDPNRSSIGADLFERLGCIACHSFAAVDANREWNRVSLQFVSSKFRPGQLARFLQTPHRHHVGGAMPDFHLTADEAANLAAYVNDNSKGTFNDFGVFDDFEGFKLSTRSVERGKKIFAEKRCNRCHQTSANDKLAAADVPTVFTSAREEKGCLATLGEYKKPSPLVFPRVGYQGQQALRMFVSSVAAGKESSSKTREPLISHAVRTLRCGACHSRDNVAARWPEIAAEEGSGKLSESVPPLTWVGEKLQGPWIEKLLKGEITQKPRPWLTARMPSFPTYATIIAHGMADEHGVPFAETLPTDFDTQQVELGRRLTLRDGGFDCRQCHGLGKELPLGDAVTQIALGVNFALTRERLRPEFALRQLLDPPRYDTASRMPRFAPDLRKTAVKQIQEGDANRQFESIKEYLFSLRVEE